MDTVPPGDPASDRPGASKPGAHRLSAPDMSDHMRSPRRTPSRLRRVIWFTVVLILCVLLLGGFWGFEQFKQKMMGQYFASMTPPPTEVETYKAATQAIPQYLTSIGTMMAVHQVTVSPELDGRISAVRFESGQAVKAGDVLVQLDDATERADLANYQAQAKLAGLNLGRAKELAAKQFSSKQSVDQLQSELEQARAGIAKSQAMIDHMVIKAPFDGMLGIRQINLGQYVAPGNAIVTLTDLDNLYVDFTLPENTRGQVSLGQAVGVPVDAFPDQVFQAALDAIDPQVDPNMRAVKLRAALSNPNHLLQPGMYGRVAVVLPPLPDVVTIPETAVDYSVYGESVYVVKEAKEKDKDGKAQLIAEQTFVTLGGRSDGKVGVVKGIKPGDVVVVGGQLKLHNGAPVLLSKKTSLETPDTVPVQ